MITIKITLDKNEIKSLLNTYFYVFNQSKAADIHALCAQENVYRIVQKLQNKLLSHREKQILSLNSNECIYFAEIGRVVYSQMGAYESAVWHRINEDLQTKINREIQIRMI